MTRNRKLALRIASLAFSLVLALSALSPAALAEEPEKLTVVYTTNILSTPLVTLAKNLGYFEEEGVSPDFIILNTGSIEALSIGKVDALLLGIIPSLSYAAQESDIKVIAGTASGGNVIVTKTENFEKYSDLKNWKDGVKLGTVRLSTSEMVTRYALGELGLDLSKDVQYVEIVGYPEIVEATRKGMVDIGFVSSEYGKAATELGLKVLFPMTYLVPDYVCCRVTANGEALRTKRGAFVKFLKAQIRAFKYFTEQPDDVVKLLAPLSEQSEDYVRNLLYNTEVNADRIFNPDPDLKRVKNVYDTLRKWNYIENTSLEASDIVDASLYKDALDQILAQYPDDPLYRKLAENYEANNGADAAAL